MKDESREESGMRFGAAKHPLRKLTIVDRDIMSKERLLHMTSLNKHDFRKVMQAFLDKIARLLHTDHNNSCKQLRMLFYQNFSDILEDVIVYLDQDFLMSLVKYLVEPLRSKEVYLEEARMINEVKNRKSNRTSQKFGREISMKGPKEMMETQDKSMMKPLDSSVMQRNLMGGNENKSMMNSILMTEYVSEKMFWVNELIGDEKIKLHEYVQRVITMGQFLESKAIEKIPNNPLIGRRISKEFCQFVSECVADQSG